MAESVERKLENANLTKENTLFVKFKNAGRGAFSFLLLFSILGCPNRCHVIANSCRPARFVNTSNRYFELLSVIGAPFCCCQLLHEQQSHIAQLTVRLAANDSEAVETCGILLKRSDRHQSWRILQRSHHLDLLAIAKSGHRVIDVVVRQHNR